MTVKVCSRCKISKPLNEFSLHRKAKDGHQAYCSSCASKYVREWEAANAERLAARRAQALLEPTDPTKTKRCPKCDEEKPLLEFYAHRSTADRRATYCKTCAKEYDKAIRGKARREYMKTYASSNGPRMRQHMRNFRLRLYGLTQERYDEMLIEQEGRCAICKDVGKETIDNRPLLVVDHNHLTNKARALLCNHCNVMLGMSDDTPSRLRAAADYLERFQT